MNGPRQKPHGDNEPAAGSLDRVIHVGIEWKRVTDGVDARWFTVNTDELADDQTNAKLEAWRTAEIERRKKRGL